MAEPVDDANDDEELVPDEDRPPDESYLVGAAGVEEEVLAEAARAEGELASGEDDEGDGAAV